MKTNAEAKQEAIKRAWRDLYDEFNNREAIGREGYVNWGDSAIQDVPEHPSEFGFYLNTDAIAKFMSMMDVYGLDESEFDFDDDPGCGLTRVNKTNRERCFKRDDYVCLKCKSGKDITIDHIKPKSLGGNNSFDNLQTLCKACNLAKGATEIDYRKKQ